MKTNLPGMEGVNIIPSSPQLIKENQSISKIKYRIYVPHPTKDDWPILSGKILSKKETEEIFKKIFDAGYIRGDGQCEFEGESRTPTWEEFKKTL